MKFINTVSFAPQNPMRKALVSPFHRGENRRSERLSNWPRLADSRQQSRGSHSGSPAPRPCLYTLYFPCVYSFPPISQGCSEIIHGKSLARWLVLGLSVSRLTSFEGELLSYVYAFSHTDPDNE